MKEIALPLYILNIVLDRTNSVCSIYGATVIESNNKLQTRFVKISMLNLSYHEIDYKINNDKNKSINQEDTFKTAQRLIKNLHTEHFKIDNYDGNYCLNIGCKNFNCQEKEELIDLNFTLWAKNILIEIMEKKILSLNKIKKQFEIVYAKYNHTQLKTTLLSFHEHESYENFKKLMLQAGQ